MTPSDLLAHLAHLGVIVTRTEAADLSLDYPAGALDVEIIRLVTAMKPDLLGLLDTSRPSATSPVAAGDDGRRVWIRAMGNLLDWPRLLLGGAESLATGEEAWLQFTVCPRNVAMVDRAVDVLNAVGHLPVDEVEQAAAAWCPEGGE